MSDNRVERASKSMQRLPRSFSMELLMSRLRRLEGLLDQRSFTFLVATIILLAFIKHGPRMYMTFGDSLLAVDGPETEVPTIFFGRWLLLARILQIPNRVSFQIFTFAVSIVILVLIAALLHRRLPRPASVAAFAAIALGQIGLVLTSQFGSADQLVLLGAALLILTGRKAWTLWAVGAILLAIGNPGQAVVASASLLLLSRISTFSLYKPRSVLALTISVVWFLSDTILTQANQADAIDAGLGESLFVSVVAGPFRLYSMYGALWLLVLLVILASFRRDLAWLSVSLIVLPFVFVLSTTDGMRVGVGTTSLVLLALVVQTSQPIVTLIQEKIGAPLVLTLTAMTIIPSMNLLGLDVILPWDWIQHEVRFWIAVSRQ